MGEAEELVEKEIKKYTIDTFDGQEDSTYKYIHIDKAKEIALEAIRLAREKEQSIALASIEKLTNTYAKTVKDAKARVREETARKIDARFKGTDFYGKLSVKQQEKYNKIINSFLSESEKVSVGFVRRTWKDWLAREEGLGK